MECDGFDHHSAWCGDIADIELYRVWKDKYVAGEFVWTGIDYLGEPNPFAYVGDANCWPGETLDERLKPRSSYFGAVDLCGIPKDRFYLYRSVWNESDETVHILPHWNWRKGDVVPVFVYTSGDEAELLLNGRSLGRRAKVVDPNVSLDPAGRWPAKSTVPENPYYKVCEKYRLRWFDVPYEPGELKAVAYRRGKKVGEATMCTAGTKAKVQLKAESDMLPADGITYAWVEVDVVDAKGVRDPLATDVISFKLSGPGEIVAVGNGDPRSYKSFKDVSSHPLYYGKCVVVVSRKAGSTEPVVLTAIVPGLESASVVFGCDKEP
jgi:beta-galactosidase